MFCWGWCQYCNRYLTLLSSVILPDFHVLVSLLCWNKYSSITWGKTKQQNKTCLNFWLGSTRGVMVSTDTLATAQSTVWWVQGCAGSYAAEAGQGKVGTGAETHWAVQTLSERAGSTGPNLPCWSHGPRAQHTSFFTLPSASFSVCNLLSAHNFRKVAYGWVVEHSSDLF